MSPLSLTALHGGFRLLSRVLHPPPPPGVFFVVCMALLMLSLIKSILVVKLLRHSEKEVRQMSVSACLLDKYGSAGHGFNESAVTSTRTLDYINTCGGRRRLPVVSFSCFPLNLRYFGTQTFGQRMVDEGFLKRSLIGTPI